MVLSTRRLAFYSLPLALYSLSTADLQRVRQRNGAAYLAPAAKVNASLNATVFVAAAKADASVIATDVASAVQIHESNSAPSGSSAPPTSVMERQSSSEASIKESERIAERPTDRTAIGESMKMSQSTEEGSADEGSVLSSLEFLATAGMLGAFLCLSCTCAYLELASGESKQLLASAGPARGAYKHRPAHDPFDPMSPYQSTAAPWFTTPPPSRLVPPTQNSCAQAPVRHSAGQNAIGGTRSSFGTASMPFASRTASAMASANKMEERASVPSKMPVLCTDFVIQNCESGFKLSLADVRKGAQTFPFYSLCGHALLHANVRPGLVCVSMEPGGKMLGGIAGAGKTLVILDRHIKEYGKLQATAIAAFKLIRNGLVEVKATFDHKSAELTLRWGPGDDVMARAFAVDDATPRRGGQEFIEVRVAPGADPVLCLLCLVGSIMEFGIFSR